MLLNGIEIFTMRFIQLTSAEMSIDSYFNSLRNDKSEKKKLMTMEVCFDNEIFCDYSMIFQNKKIIIKIKNFFQLTYLLGKHKPYLLFQ